MVKTPIGYVLFLVVEVVMEGGGGKQTRSQVVYKKVLFLATKWAKMVLF